MNGPLVPRVVISVNHSLIPIALTTAAKEDGEGMRESCCRKIGCTELTEGCTYRATVVDVPLFAPRQCLNCGESFDRHGYNDDGEAHTC